MKTKIMDLLEKVSYPHSLDIKIESTEDVLEKYGIYIGKGIKYLEDRFLSDFEMNFKENKTDFTELKFTNPK